MAIALIGIFGCASAFLFMILYFNSFGYIQRLKKGELDERETGELFRTSGFWELVEAAFAKAGFSSDEKITWRSGAISHARRHFDIKDE